MTVDFPAPWTVVEATGEFRVQDATGRTLCHFYWWGHPEAVRLTQVEARCLAEQFAEMPDTLSGYPVGDAVAGTGPSTDFVPSAAAALATGADTQGPGRFPG
jgi:hypothetical protein